MERKGWYLVCYDIANPKRLGRIHRYLKKRCVRLQKSIFLYHGSHKKMVNLLDDIEQLINTKADKISAYPICHPDRIWTNAPEDISFMFGGAKPKMPFKIKMIRMLQKFTK